MCLSIPGRIVELNGAAAVVDILGASREISVELVPGLAIGDYVLVHAGCAIQKVDEEEARSTINLFNELKDVMNG